MSVYQRVHVCETMNIVCKVYVGCMQLGCCSSSTAFHAFIIEGSGSILVHTAVANPIKPNNPNPTNQHSNPTSQPMGKPTNLDRLPWPWQLMLSLGSSWLRVAWFTWLLVGLWVDQPPPLILQVKRIQNRVSLWLEDDSDFLLDMYVLCVCCVCCVCVHYWLPWLHRLGPQVTMGSFSTCPLFCKGSGVRDLEKWCQMQVHSCDFVAHHDSPILTQATN